MTLILLGLAGVVVLWLVTALIGAVGTEKVVDIFWGRWN
jgi:hypothetical protein